MRVRRIALALLAAFPLLMWVTDEPAEGAAPTTMSRAQVGQVAVPGMWWIPHVSQLAQRSGFDYIRLARQTAFANPADCPICPTLADLANASTLPGGQGLYRLTNQAPAASGGSLACPTGQHLVVLRGGSFCAAWVLWGGFVGYETVLGAAGSAWQPAPAGLPTDPEPPASACDVQQWYQSPDRSWGIHVVWRSIDGMAPGDLAARTAQGWAAETADWAQGCGSGGAAAPANYLVRASLFGRLPAGVQAR